MLDAPCPEDPPARKQRRSTIMVGGDAGTLETCASAPRAPRPADRAHGRNWRRSGRQGVQRSWRCSSTRRALAEALSLGAECGLDPRSPASGHVWAASPRAGCSRCSASGWRRASSRPGWPTRLYDKDLNIVLDLAQEAGQEVPAAAVVRRHLDRVVADGKSNRDLAALIEIVERAPELNDVRLVD